MSHLNHQANNQLDVTTGLSIICDEAQTTVLNKGTKDKYDDRSQVGAIIIPEQRDRTARS